MTPDGTTAWVTSLDADELKPINLATNRGGPAIRVLGGPFAIAITERSRAPVRGNRRRPVGSFVTGRRPLRAVLACSLPVTVRPASRQVARPERATLTFTVNTAADAHAAPRSRGSAPTERGCFLRAAIEVADATSAPTVVKLPLGTYRFRLGELVVTDAPASPSPRERAADGHQRRRRVTAGARCRPRGRGQGQQGRRRRALPREAHDHGRERHPRRGGPRGVGRRHRHRAPGGGGGPHLRRRRPQPGGGERRGDFDAGDLWLCGSTRAANAAASKVATEPAAGGGLDVNNGSASLSATSSPATRPPATGPPAAGSTTSPARCRSLVVPSRATPPPRSPSRRSRSPRAAVSAPPTTRRCRARPSPATRPTRRAPRRRRAGAGRRAGVAGRWDAHRCEGERQPPR